MGLSRAAVPKSREDSRCGDSTFVGFVWFVVTILSLVPAEGAARSRAVCIPFICGSRPSVTPANLRGCDLSLSSQGQ